jgi:hypothetical protein
MASVLDKFKVEVRKPESGGYKAVANEVAEDAFGEIVGDLRERLRDQRDIAGILKSQVENLQTDNRRSNEKMDKLESIAGRMQKQLVACQKQLIVYETKLRALGVDPDAIRIEDKRNGRSTDDDESDGNKGE